MQMFYLTLFIHIQESMWKGQCEKVRPHDSAQG